MVVVGIVEVDAVLVEFEAGLQGLVGLVAVHRPQRQPGQSEREGPACHGQDASAERQERAVHFTGLP